MIEELTELEHLLRRHGHYAQADVVDELLRLHAADQRAAFEDAVTGLMWGGSGSVADVYLSYESPRPKEEAQAEVKRFHSLMAALATALEIAGLGSPRTRQLGALFQSWSAPGA
jgi:hypothetical protein